MIKVRFGDDEVTSDVSFYRDDNIVTLRGITHAPKTGFTTWRMDGKTQLGDFSDYTTIYRVLNDAIQLSNDGSVYVEPDVLETPEQPSDPQPTQLDRIEAQVLYTALMTDTILEEV